MTDPGHRLQWAEVPPYVRADLEQALGSAVVEAVNQRGGYGPSLAARCGLADGRRAFIKAVSPAQNPDSPGMMRREAKIARCLPAEAPAPALLHELDDDEWIALVFEHVDGRLPVMPWDPHELQRVMASSSGPATPSAARFTRGITARCSRGGARSGEARARRWTWCRRLSTTCAPKRGGRARRAAAG
jgi:hypothetical protein